MAHTLMFAHAQACGAIAAQDPEQSCFFRKPALAQPQALAAGAAEPARSAVVSGAS